jgi:hypothetical protein
MKIILGIKQGDLPRIENLAPEEKTHHVVRRSTDRNLIPCRYQILVLLILGKGRKKRMHNNWPESSPSTELLCLFCSCTISIERGKKKLEWTAAVALGTWVCSLRLLTRVDTAGGEPP